MELKTLCAIIFIYVCVFYKVRPQGSREALELSGLLTPDDSIVNSGASPDGRPSGLLCPADRWTGEFITGACEK